MHQALAEFLPNLSIFRLKERNVSSRYSVLKSTNSYDMVKLLGSCTTRTSCSGEIRELWFFIEAETTDFTVKVYISKAMRFSLCGVCVCVCVRKGQGWQGGRLTLRQLPYSSSSISQSSCQVNPPNRETLLWKPLFPEQLPLNGLDKFFYLRPLNLTGKGERGTVKGFHYCSHF